MAVHALKLADMGSSVLQREAPRRAPHELERPQLELPAELRRGELGLAFLCAPAGYGKSTVMARWRDAFQADGVACCWLELRDKHRDPKTLLQCLMRALAHQMPDLRLRQTETSLRSATSNLVEPLLASFMQDMDAHGKRVVLFLDDLEVLGDSAGLEAIRLIVSHRVDMLSLVLGGRDVHQLSLSRERLAGQLIERRATDMSFSRDEIRQLFREKFSLPVDASVIDEVFVRTEGWPAAVGLYGLGLARGHARPSFADVSGSGEELGAFLGEVMFDNLSPQERELCMRAALPEHFSVALLEVLIPEMPPTQALSCILGCNPFVRTLVAPQPQYRFHSLCQSDLRRRMREHSPILYADLFRRLSDWCWDHGEKRSAVNYAREAGDWSLMAERISELAESMVRETGEFDTFLQWLRDLPAHVLKQHPDLFLRQAWALSFKRDMAQAEIALARLEALLPRLEQSQADELQRQLDSHRLMIDSILDRAHPKLDQARAWLTQHAEAPPAERAALQCILATAARNANQPQAALQALEQAEAIYQRVAPGYSLSWVHNIRLSVLIKHGAFTEAAVTGERALQCICESLGKQSPAAGMSHAMLGYLSYEKGDIQAARDHLDQSLRFIRSQGVVDSLYYAHLTLAWLALDDGNTQLAADILLEGERLGIELCLPRLTTQLAKRRVLLYLHSGDEMAAEALIESRKLLHESTDAFAESRAQSAELIRLNIELIRGQFREAAERAKTLSRAAAANGGLRMKAEYDYLWAIALQGSGESNEAGRKFRELLAQMAIQQRYRFLLQYRSLARGLINDHLNSRRQEWNSGVVADAADGVLLKMAEELGLDNSDEADVEHANVIESLTKREVNILKRAALSGLNNRKLAEALFVTEGTLKWHLQNIYRKLDVKNRAGAIAQARKMGLLVV